MTRHPPDDELLTRMAHQPWTQAEVDLLHEMVKEYGHAKWFRKQLRWWGLWLFGLPAGALAFWEPLEKLYRLLRGALK